MSRSDQVDVSLEEQQLRHKTLLAESGSRERALTNSLENALDRLRGTSAALAEAEEERQRLHGAFSETTTLSEHLTERLEELGRDNARLASEVEDRTRQAARVREELRLAEDRAASAENDKRLLNSHIEWLQRLFDEQSQKVEFQASSLLEVQKRIASFVYGRMRWWDHIRQLVGLPPLSLAYQELAQWRPELSFTQLLGGSTQLPGVPDQEYPMQFSTVSGDRNPFLRANSLPELLTWDDVEFVRCAYVTVLGRQPDAEGEAHYTSYIRNGHSKLKLLWDLRTSAEGSNHDPGIVGFDRTLRRAAWGRALLIGRLIRLWTGTEGNTWTERRHRALLNELARFRNEQLSQRQLIGAIWDRVAALSGSERTGQEAAAGSRSHSSSEGIKPLESRNNGPSSMERK